MKHFLRITILAIAMLTGSMQMQAQSQGWAKDYSGVMLQAFSWDSFVDTQWTNLTAQADELSQYFSLIWIPQSGNCNSTYNQMGYTPVYYFNQNSSFGTEQQLRTMISTFKQKGTKFIADVVINHRNNLGVNGSWVDYPEETYKGVTYKMLPTDICADDDGGETKKWATSNGISISQNNDTGEGWDGCRDLDHKSENVQTIVKAYLKYLLNDLGYAGFRYDMTKGFSRSYLADYNYDSRPDFSVGEYWDGNASNLQNVIDQQKKDGQVQSGTFDFAFRYTVRDAINGNNWSKLGNSSLMSNASYRRYAVTFVENHDMQDRGTTNNYNPDPIKKDTLAANAYLLAMPGTPCVFLTHWKAYKQDIKAMIAARQIAGITNESNYQNMASNAQYYANSVEGSKGKLLVVVGYANMYTPSADWVQILAGHHYRYYLSKSTETAWANIASGEFPKAFDVKLNAVSEDSNAQLVYTLDGSNPTVNSTKVANNTSITIDNSCTLKVGLLKNGSVTGIQTYQYTIKPFEAHTATIYLKDPQWSTPVYFYAWANDSKNTQLLGGWPGTSITTTKEIDGVKYYYRSFDINTEGYSFNIIFDQGSGKKQTVDIGPLSEDTYYEIGSEVNGKFTVNDITSQVNIGGGEEEQEVKYVGGDISLLTKYEEHGAKYYDNNGQSISSLLPYFKEEGMNTMRVRLFVDPQNATAAEKDQGVCQDLAYVKTLGKKIKDAGFKLMLDIHYSDTWADPAKQWTPKDWLNLSDSELQEKVYSYTKEVLQEMKTAGAEPDFIQTGNEISYGMLWGEGIITTNTAEETKYETSSSTYKKVYAGQSANWSRFIGLLKQAGKACREVCPDAKIVIHTERAANSNYLSTYYSALNSDNIDYDIIGMSYYPHFHGALSVLEGAINKAESDFPDKKIMIVETGYSYRWEVPGSTYTYTSTYPYSETGQKNFTEDLITMLNKHNNVNGLFWWMMEANENGLDWNTQRVTRGWYNASLVDNENGHFLAAISSLKNFLSDSGSTGIADIRTDKSSDRTIYDLQGRRMGSDIHGLRPGIYIVGKKKVYIK
ncbi:MAG: glycosyl hydrolase 53 family protein [Prevotella sp.]|nr:glycosyl hydrolase 53 family protein [Prevotella sp.]